MAKPTRLELADVMKWYREPHDGNLVVSNGALKLIEVYSQTSDGRARLARDVEAALRSAEEEIARAAEYFRHWERAESALAEMREIAKDVCDRFKWLPVEQCDLSWDVGPGNRLASALARHATEE